MSVFLKIFDDLFADNFSFEAAQSAFYRFVIVNIYKCHLSFHPLSAKITCRAEQCSCLFHRQTNIKLNLGCICN